MKQINTSLIIVVGGLVIVSAAIIGIMLVLGTIDSDQATQALIKTGLVLLIVLVAGLAISSLTRSSSSK